MENKNTGPRARLVIHDGTGPSCPKKRQRLKDLALGGSYVDDALVSSPSTDPAPDPAIVEAIYAAKAMFDAANVTAAEIEERALFNGPQAVEFSPLRGSMPDFLWAGEAELWDFWMSGLAYDDWIVNTGGFLFVD